MKLVFIALVILPQISGAQDAKEIVGRYIETVSGGSIENWKNLKSVYMETTGAYSQDNFNQEKADFDLMKPNFSKRYMVSPDKDRIETYTDSTCTTLLSTFTFLRDKTIIVMGNVPPIVKDFGNNGKVLQFTPLTIWDITNENRKGELLGTKSFPNESGTFYEIKVRDKKNIYHLFFNTKTYLLEFWNNSPNDDLSVLTRFSQYEKFGDYLIPTNEVMSRNGVPYFWTRILKMEVNVPIDPEKFVYKTD